MKSYLKGFHLAEEAWRPGRDEEGWKVDEEEDEDLDEEAETDEHSTWIVQHVLQPSRGWRRIRFRDV